MTTRYQKPKNILSEELDGEVLCIDELTGTYFSMAGTATASWNLLVAGCTSEEVIDRARSSHSDEPRVAADVEGFVARLIEIGLLEPRSDGSNGESPTVDWGKSWSAPDVGVHSDMQDILLFDPIHQVDYEKGWPHRPEDQAV